MRPPRNRFRPALAERHQLNRALAILPPSPCREQALARQLRRSPPSAAIVATPPRSDPRRRHRGGRKRALGSLLLRRRPPPLRLAIAVPCLQGHGSVHASGEGLAVRQRPRRPGILANRVRGAPEASRPGKRAATTIQARLIVLEGRSVLLVLPAVQPPTPPQPPRIRRRVAVVSVLASRPADFSSCSSLKTAKTSSLASRPAVL